MSEQPFFERRSTKLHIKELATGNPIIPIVGAGVAADAGLPAWHSLIRTLLQQLAADDLGIETRQEQRRFADTLIREHGYITCASIVQAAFGEVITLEAVRMALYRRVGAHAEPGFHATAVANVLIKQFAASGAARAITTNYDQLVEDAIRKGLSEVQGVAAKALTVVSKAEPIPEGPVIPVYHLHGFVAASWDDDTRGSIVGARDNRIILGERDYAHLQQGNQWQEEIMEEALASGVVPVFTGMSLSDPNMIRYLTLHTSNTSVGGKRYALLSKQADHRWLSSLTPRLRDQYYDLVSSRLNSLGVTVILADYYVQVAQFFNEVFLYQTYADNWDESLSYGQRLNTWRRQATAAGYSAHGNFSTRQDQLRSYLNRLMDSKVLPLLEKTRVDLRERFGVELWLRDTRVGHRGLVLWGSSGQAWSSFDDLSQASLSIDSEYSAALAFMRAGYVYRPNGRPGSRWKMQLSQVIRLEKEPWFNLPAGVIVLSSSAGPDDSVLNHLSPAVARDLQDLLLEHAVKLADPDAVTETLGRRTP